MNVMTQPPPIEEEVPVAPVTPNFYREEWEKVREQLPRGLHWRLMKAEQAAHGLEAMIDILAFDTQARHDLENGAVNAYKSPFNQRVLGSFLEGMKNLSFQVVESYEIIRSSCRGEDA